MGEKLQSTLSNLDAFKEMIAAQTEAEAKLAEQAADEAEADAAAEEHTTEMCYCVEAAYIIAAADGATTDDEVKTLAQRMCQLTDEQLQSTSVERMIQDAAYKLATDGQQARIDAIAGAITGDKRIAAFLVAAGVSWTGGGVGQKEGLALQALSRAFEIPMNEMHKLMAQAHA